MAPINRPQNVIAVKTAYLSDNRAFIAAGYVIVLLLCVPLFFIGLGCPPVIDPDEPVYAATGSAMLQSGSFAGWWSPHYDGALWFDKPPMTYWLIGLSMKFLGQTALAARFPSAICALILVVLTAYFTKRLWPRSTFAGIWAAAAIASCFQTCVLARAAVTDMVLVTFLTAAIIGMWNWLIDDRQIGWLLGAGIATGLATLTKGPVAIVLVGGAVLFYLVMTRQARRLTSPVLWLSLLLALAIALPWYVSMVHEHGQLFISDFLEANNLTRYLKPEHPQTSSLLWFLPVLLGFIFPWTVPLLLALWSGWKAMQGGDRGALLAIIWILWVFVFFSESQTKLLTYIYPLYPAAAALIGYWIDDGPSRKERLACGIVFAMVAALIAIILPGYVSRGNGLIGAREILQRIDVVFAASSALALLSLAPVFEQSKVRRQLVFAIPVFCMAVFFSLVALSSLWKQSLPDLSMTEMASEIESHSSPNVPTIALALNKPSLVFYSSRHIIFIENRKTAIQQMIVPPYMLCVFKNVAGDNPLPDVEKDFPPGHLKILSHSGVKYVLIKYQR